MPNFASAPSTCCGLAPSSSRNRLCWPYFSSMRLPMKPSHTPETTGTFFSVLPSFMVVASTSLAVCFASHNLQQAHHVGGGEEVRADHVLRAAWCAWRSC